MSTPVDLQALYAEAERALQGRDPGRAEALYRQILAAAPGAVMAQRNLGLVLVSTNQHAIAQPLLEAAAEVQMDKNHGLALADCWIRAGRFDDARRLLDQLLSRQPDLIAALKLLGRIATLMDDDQRAAEVQRQILDRDPRNTEALLAYAGHIAESRPSEACALLREAAADPVLSLQARCQLAAAAAAIVEKSQRIAEGLIDGRARCGKDMFPRHCRDDLRQAAALAAMWCEAEPQNAHAWRRKAVIAAACGDIAGAQADFVRSAEASGQADAPWFSYAPELIAPFDPGANPPPVPTPAEFLIKAAFPGDHVFFIGCDLPYLRKYGCQFLRSIDDTCPNAQIHLHLMDMTDDARPEVEGFVASLPKSRLAVTQEHLGFADAPAPIRGCIYTIARMRVAMRCARYYERCLWMMDADALFNRDPRPLVDAMGIFDMAVILLPAFDPWLLFPAGTIVIGPTVRARRLAGLIDGFLGQRLVAGRIEWGTDQVAPYCAWHYLQAAGVEVDLRGLPLEVVAFGDPETSCIWLQHGKFKTITAAFAQSDQPITGLRQRRYAERFRTFTR